MKKRGRVMEKTTILQLQKLLDEATESGLECGCQLAIYENGELVADLCSGYTAPDRRRKVEPDTLFPVFSVGKGLFTTAIHRMVEKGTLAYSTRLGELWPEFDCEGKEHLLFWHVLTHRSGLFMTPEHASFAELADWNLMCRRMAAMRPEWTPGTRCRYQSFSYAWLAGEPLMRADGRPLKQILTDEVIRPLGMGREIFFGISDEAEARMAPLDTSRVGGEFGHALLIASPEILRSCIPSFNGVMTARAVARHYAALEREIDGVRLLRPETLENAAIPRRAADDPFRPETDWAHFGLGYVAAGFPEDPSGLIGHGGAIGSEGLLDRRRHLALGFTKNKVDPAHPNHSLRDWIASLLGLPVRHW